MCKVDRLDRNAGGRSFVAADGRFNQVVRSVVSSVNRSWMMQWAVTDIQEIWCVRSMFGRTHSPVEINGQDREENGRERRDS